MFRMNPLGQKCSGMDIDLRTFSVSGFYRQCQRQRQSPRG